MTMMEGHASVSVGVVDAEGKKKLTELFRAVDSKLRLDAETAQQSEQLYHLVVALDVRQGDALYNDDFFSRRCVATAIFITSVLGEQKQRDNAKPDLSLIHI